MREDYRACAERSRMTTPQWQADIRQLSAELIEREVAVLPHIADALPLAISHPIYIGAPAPEYACVFAGYAQIAGATACSFPFTDAMRVELAEPLGAFLRALHAIDPQPFLARGLVPDTLACAPAMRRCSRREPSRSS